MPVTLRHLLQYLSFDGCISAFIFCTIMSLCFFRLRTISVLRTKQQNKNKLGPPYLNLYFSQSIFNMSAIAYLLGRLTFCIRSLISQKRIFENKSFGILHSWLYLLRSHSLLVCWKLPLLFCTHPQLESCNTYDALGLLVQVPEYLSDAVDSVIND